MMGAQVGSKVVLPLQISDPTISKNTSGNAALPLLLDRTNYEQARQAVEPTHPAYAESSHDA